MNRYAYTQVIDPVASCEADLPNYGALAKLYFGEQISEGDTEQEEPIRIEYHAFEKNVFCSGSAFVPKEGGLEEDDGWIITFDHNEDTEISQFSGEAVAKCLAEFLMDFKSTGCNNYIPGPKDGMIDTKWFSRCCNEWRLNMGTGEVKEKYLSAPDQFMDFPVINPCFTGIKNRYAYTQVVDPVASFGSDSPKYGALAKVDKVQDEPIRVESGIAFVPKEGGLEEDDMVGLSLSFTMKTPTYLKFI